LAETEINKVVPKKRSLFHRIVNIFLYTGLGLFIILLLLFSISQTSTFREFLRQKVVSIANQNLNGTLYINKIDGTIFTSLILRHTVLNMGMDTILNAGTIEVRTSPLQLLLKKIKVRKIEISNAAISLVSDSTGKLNISALTHPTKPDTAKSTFPFKIEVNNFILSNISFNLQKFYLTGSTAYYDKLNMDDFRVKYLNLKLNASADIHNNDYQVDLTELSFSPNINNFNLKELSGQFAVNKKELFANNLRIFTTNSDLLIKAKSEFNIFDSTQSFSKARLDLNLSSDKFNFIDVSPFVPSLNLLKGDLSIHLNAKGTFKELTVDLIDIKFLKSHLQTKGIVKNLDRPQQMFISAVFKDTYIFQADVDKLLPGIHMRVYEKFGLLKFDTLTFTGNPLNFKTSISLITDKGKLIADSHFNFEKTPSQYEMNFRTIGFDISPIANINTNLNSKGNIKGAGFNPREMTATVSINADGSSISGNRIDSLQIDANAADKKINYNLSIVADTSSIDMFGFINLLTEKDPSYKFTGNFNKIDLHKFVQDSSLISSLNFSVNAEGTGFDQDNLDLYLTLMLKNSTINGIYIDSTRAIADIRRDTGAGRVINLISDLADISVTGKFTFSSVAEALSDEINLFTSVSKKKSNEFFTSNQSLPFQPPVITPAITRLKKSQVIDSPSSLKYLVEFKDFALLSLFLGHAQIEINGEMSGELRNTKDSIYFSYLTDIDYIKYKKNDEAFLISSLHLGLNVANFHDSEDPGNIIAKLELNTDRVFAGADIRDIHLGVDLKNQIANVNFFSRLENSSAKLNGSVDISGRFLKLLLDTLLLDYKGIKLKNKGRAELNYAENELNINNFVLTRDSAELNIKGTLSRYKNQSLEITLKNLSARDIALNLGQLRPENSPDANVGFSTEITGNLENPLIKFNLMIDNVSYKNKNFGSLAGGFNYLNKDLTFDFKFTGPLLNQNDADLKITGNLPVDLGYSGASPRMSYTIPMDIRIIAGNFNLEPVGDFLPMVKKIRGILKADLEISGTYNNLKPKGYLDLSKAAFVSEQNNLEYNAEMRLSILDQDLNLENVQISNVPGTMDGGILTGKGTAVMKNFNLVSSNFNVSGALKVLGDESKTASPSVYGDLVIATKGNVEFTMNEDGAFLKAPIEVKKAKLVFPPTQSAYRNTSDNFIYKYISDTIGVRRNRLDTLNIGNLTRRTNTLRNSKNVKKSSFDYSIDVSVNDEATIVFVLSKELNQNLTAVLKGNFLYERIDGKSNAQGELTLLEGSTLEFIKTLQAAGTIRFESDLSNPNLDITATYKGYYYPADSSTTNVQEVAVAVKIKITGPLKDLDKKFVKEENNFAVYYGQDNIDNNIPDPTKDASDAAMFLVAGKFASDMTPQDKSAASGQLSNTATSMAGGILGGILNKQLGDYVRSVELRRAGSTTKFNISGTLPWKLRYSIGGTTDVFQDLNQANIKFEYPILNSLLLRLERKQAVTETTSSNEMINELGLKYRFEF
jgi:hypothetical protein